MKMNILKTFGASFGILVFSLSQASASFMFQEIDPICSLSGTTHTSFPGEISDTSSWNIPTAYEGKCDETPKLSEAEKEKIFQIMNNFFKSNSFYGLMYSLEVDNTSKNLNRNGENFVQKTFFPAISSYINTERAKINTNTKSIAILNYAVQTIGYDYYIFQK